MNTLRRLSNFRFLLVAALAANSTEHTLAAEPQQREALFACAGVQNLTGADGTPKLVNEPAEAQILIKTSSVVVGAGPTFYSREIPIAVETEFQISFAHVNGSIGHSGNFNKVTGALKLADHHDTPPYWWAEYSCKPAKKLLQ